MRAAAAFSRPGLRRCAAPRQELGLQLGEAIERIAQHNLPGFAAEQGVEQRPGGEGGCAGDGNGEAFNHQRTFATLKCLQRYHRTNFQRQRKADSQK